MTNQTVELHCGDCLEWLCKQPDNSVDLVFGSPPYVGKGQRYGRSSFADKQNEWVRWMERIIAQSCAVSTGPVMFVVNDCVREDRLVAATAELVYRMSQYKTLRVERPLIWHKNSPPSRQNGQQWFSNAYETILCFSGNNRFPFDWEKVAKPKKYENGGAFRQRSATGERKIGSEYPKGALARPRDVIYAPVGGGMLGHKLRHENEAPFPESLVEQIIPAFVGPDKTVLDPFCGSGTTLHVGYACGANVIGIDIRQSQLLMTKQIFRERGVDVA